MTYKFTKLTRNDNDYKYLGILNFMKICIFSQKRKGGGGFISTLTLRDALKKRGHSVISTASPEEIENSDVVLHQNILDMKKAQKICEKKKIPLVITVNGFISCTKGTHIKRETKYGVPCYKCSVLGSFFCSPKEKSVLKQRIPKILSSIPRYAIFKDRIKTLNKANRVVCISPTLKRMLRIAGVKNEINVIPQPVDSVFLKDPKVRLFDERSALCIGRTWAKGAHLAAEAVSMVDNVKLISLSRIQREDFKVLIRSYLGERVEFYDWVPSSEMPKYYYSSHVVLFPSLWFEGYARVFSEAMMCGKPVVALNNGRGATDYLKHEYNALVSDFNVKAYASQIKRLFEDEKLYRKISRNALKYAKENFSIEVVAKKYEKLFEEVLNAS